MGELPSSEKDFRSFYRTTLSPLRRYLAMVLGNPHEAQDVAHDAYLRVYSAMREKQVHQPKAFLFTTARRLALNFRMRRAGRMRPEENSVLDREAAATPDAASLMTDREEREAMETAILSLPEGCRAVLILRITEELSHHEIAERLGISRSTVEKHLARALRLLRETMAGKPSHPDPS